MIEAVKEANKAYKKKEIPVGAVIVKNNKIIAKAHNTRQKTHNLLGHAEINCILKAEKKIKDWRLSNCDMYITLEPCSMCRIFIEEARIKNVYILLKRKDTTKTFVRDDTKKAYSELIKDFFINLRH